MALSRDMIRAYRFHREHGGYIVGESARCALDAARAVQGVELFHAGTSREGDQLRAIGGRVLNVTARDSAARAGFSARVNCSQSHSRTQQTNVSRAGS